MDNNKKYHHHHHLRYTLPTYIVIQCPMASIYERICLYFHPARETLISGLFISLGIRHWIINTFFLAAGKNESYFWTIQTICYMQ